MQRTQLTLAVIAGLLLLAASAVMGLGTIASGRDIVAGLGLPMPDGPAQVHAALGALFAAAVAGAMAAVAARDDGPLPGLVLGLAGLLALWALLRAGIDLAPDLAAQALAPAGLAPPGGETLALWRDMSGGAALGLILLAAGCLVGARPGYGWLGFFLQLLSAAVVTLYLVELAAGGSGSSAFLVLIPLLTLLALLAAQLADEDVPAAPYLFGMTLLGLVVTVRAGLALAGVAPGPDAAASVQWTGHLAIAAPFFGLFAALNRAAPGQHGGWIWVHALGLAALALPAMGPMTGVPEAAPGAPIWGFAFYGWVLLGLTVAARRYAGRSAARESE